MMAPAPPERHGERRTEAPMVGQIERRQAAAQFHDFGEEPLVSGTRGP